MENIRQKDKNKPDTNRRFYPNTSRAMRGRMSGRNPKTKMTANNVAEGIASGLKGPISNPISQQDKGQTPVSGMKDGGMTMVKKAGKMVPDFAADGIGKMKDGGPVKSKMERRGYGAARKPS
tara:strand:+ start:805 stop:1170 length:366 start_codon:yes stop_codon:yes gene_type:complete